MNRLLRGVVSVPRWHYPFDKRFSTSEAIAIERSHGCTDVRPGLARPLPVRCDIPSHRRKRRNELKSWRDAPVAEQSYIARAWLAKFGETLQHREYARAALMIHPDGYWRDLLTFGWIFKTLHGIEDVEAWLTETFDANRAYDFCLEGEPQIGAFGDYNVTLQF